MGSRCRGVGLGTGIYSIAAQLISLAIGAFAAGRLAANPLKLNSGLHGVAVWALATLGMLYIATTTVGSVVGGAVGAVSSAGQAAADAAGAAMPDNLQLGQIDKQDLPQSVQDAMDKQGLTVKNIQDEAMASYQAVLSDQEKNEIQSEVTDTAAAVAQNPGNASQEISQMVDSLFGGPNAALSEEDKQEMTTQMSKRLGVSEEEAKTMIDKWETQASEAAGEVETAMQDAQKQATQSAQAASENLAKVAFAAFAASVAGLLIAFLSAMLGRTEPDAAVAARS